MKALIFSGGEFFALPDSINVKEYDIIIGADKGYFYAKSVGVIPDIFVGDKDSLPETTEILSKTKIILECEKDATDTKEAVDIAILKGAKFITVLGALGNRTDHTLANIFLLKYGHEKNVKIELLDTDTYITLISDYAEIFKRDGFCLSLIPLTDCSNVSVSGVYYPLTNADLSVGTTLGVSNEFVSDSAKISIGNGFLLAMVCKS